MNVCAGFGSQLDKFMEEILRIVKYKEAASASRSTESLKLTLEKYCYVLGLSWYSDLNEYCWLMLDLEIDGFMGCSCMHF